jgi:Tol biopolymer transport system component
MVAPFDAERLEVTGPAASVPLDVMVDDVSQASPLPQLAVSQGGTLVYAPNDPTRVGPSTFAWVDRGGHVEDIATLPILQPLFALSPDGTRMAISSRAGSKVQLQLYDLASRTLTTLEAHPQDYPSGPVWSSEGRRVFSSRFTTHLGAMVLHDLDGSSEPQELVSMPGTYFSANALTKDGRFLAFSIYNTETNSQDNWLLDLDAPAGKEAARPFLDTSASEINATVSPDGRWIAYVSDEAGELNVYLRRFPGGEAKRKVSNINAWSPLWSADGRELFFQSASASGSKMFATEVHEEPELSFSEPRPLFEGRFLCCSSDVGRTYAVAPDGRFLMVRGGRFGVARELVVVQNWFTEIERLAPRKR